VSPSGVLFSLVTMAAPVAPAAPPPAILQIYREPILPGGEAEYDRIESETANKCAELRCPHAYLGLESLTGPKEVWWFNGFVSEADRKEVTDTWAKSTEVVAALARNRERKAPFTGKGIEVFAHYRADLSQGAAWVLGRGRFLVIATTRGAPPLEGAVYETSDGTRLVIAPARTRAEAEAAAAGIDARVLAARPRWSHPAEDWIAADPEFWRPQR
jgi:hypothetical protein